MSRQGQLRGTSCKNTHNPAKESQANVRDCAVLP